MRRFFPMTLKYIAVMTGVGLVDKEISKLVESRFENSFSSPDYNIQDMKNRALIGSGWGAAVGVRSRRCNDADYGKRQQPSVVGKRN